MLIRLLRKSYNAFRYYGIKTFFYRVYVFFDRKLRPGKFYYLPVDFKAEAENKSGAAKKILFISGEPKNATSYYRCEIPALQLANQGCYADIVYEDFADKVDISTYDYVIFYRTPYSKKNKDILEFAKKNAIKTIFSVDDFVYRRDLLEKLEYTSYLDEDDAKRLLDRAEGMVCLMRECDAGIASTEPISKDMGRYIEGPILINRNGYKDNHSEFLKLKNTSKVAKDGKIILGYFSGSETHDRDFAVISKTIFPIIEDFSQVELWIGGHIKLSEKNLNQAIRQRVRKIPFLPRNEFNKIMLSVDINLLPLENTKFNQGKSEVKFIEAGLFEIPTISSAVGDMEHIISHRKTGFIAGNGKEWQNALIELIGNQDLRKELGKNAREYVLREYSVQKLGKELFKFLDKV